jgi:hypothetical protein
MGQRIVPGSIHGSTTPIFKNTTGNEGRIRSWEKLRQIGGKSAHREYMRGEGVFFQVLIVLGKF